MCTMSYSRWYKFEAERLIWVKVMAEFDIVTNVHLDLLIQCHNIIIIRNRREGEEKATLTPQKAPSFLLLTIHSDAQNFVP